MKNKVNLKKCLIKIFIVTISLLFIYLILNIYEYNTYTKNYNKKISQILTVISEKYPEASQNELIEILNNNTSNNTNIFNKYGIDIENTSLINENDSNFKIFIIYNIVLLIMGITIITIIFLKYNLKREKDVKDITKCIEQINKKNYEIKIDSMSEDELSILKNEIYKTTIMLKETAENSKNDKIKLKQSLEDISHQLKTPLSALMMYQEIIENEPENFETVKEFSLKIGTALKRMEQLIQSMLKITRIDAGSISFEKSNYSIPNIINHAISELTTRADNEKKEIVIDGDLEQMLYCDIEWTGEAIGNIIKNALDHTDTGGKISISWEQTPAMIRIFITDNGHGISQEDIHHIFKRFYRSKNTSESQGIGLGLPLAKAIVEGQGGILSVQSELLQGTTFTLSFLTES